MDDQAALMGDWAPPSPTSKAFFSSFLGGDEQIQIGSGPMLHIPEEARCGSSSFGSYHVTGGTDRSNVKQGGSSYENDLMLNPFADVKRRVGLGDRIAARAGFNAPRLNTESIRSRDRSSTDEVKSPYLTIPPGISPTALLESPVFLSNSLTQASPTTGKFLLFPDRNLRGTTMVTSEQSKEDFFDDIDGSSFAFKPHLEPSLPFSLGVANKMGQSMNIQAISNIDVTIRSENTFQNFIPSQIHSHEELSQSLKGKDHIERTAGAETRCLDTISDTAEHSPPLSDQQDDEGDQRVTDDAVTGGCAGSVEEDGYNWRKYGQKQVKGSEFPRSYYKCTHMTCPVKKKVERSREGHVTEIIYTGEHNHPKPALNRRLSTGFNQFDETNGVENGGDGVENGGDRTSSWEAGQNGLPHGWRNESFENSNSLLTSMNSEFRNSSPPLQVQNGALVESGDAVDPSSTFTNDEEDDCGTHGSASIANDGEGDEPESKRRKIETYTAEIGSGATRAIREPRVVVQTTSDVDILDDGYRWRKYGQKVVKGNPNPRSYYKCTSVGCTVRKHVERASHDLKSVITTYEGKHNHDVPPARNSSHINSSTSTAFATQPQNLIQRPDPSQVTNMPRYERAPYLNSFSMPMMHQPFVPPLPMSMNQASLTNLSVAGLGPKQNKYPARPVHPYLMQQHQQQQQQQQQRQMNDLMMPKGDAKVEPNSDPNLFLPNESSVYHQIMNRLPLGP